MSLHTFLGVVDEDAEEDNESGCGSDKSTSEADEAVENAVDP